VTVTVSTEGGSGTIYREYKLDDAGWQEYTAPVVISSQGAHTLQYRASSDDDATDIESLSFKIDSDAPVSSATVDEEARTVTLRGADAESGLDHVEYSDDNGETWTTYEGAIEVGDDLVEIRFRAVDKAGNVENANLATVPAAGVELATSATAALGAATTAYGSPYSVTVRVTGAGGVPTGTVDIVSDQVAVGTATLVNGRATVALTPLTVLPGDATLTVRYSGDEVFAASTDTVDVTVTKATSKVTAKFSKSTIKYGSKAKMTITVSSAAPVTGTVIIKNGSATIVRTVTLVNGKATVTLPTKFRTGSRYITVRYSGSDTVAPSTSAKVKLTVKK